MVAVIARSVKYAGFWKRLAAYLIDGLVLQIPCVGLWLLFRSIWDGSFREYSNMLVIGALVAWPYFACMESSRLQATVGKHILGVRVTGLYGQRVSFGRATLRYFSKIPSGMCFGLGFVAAAFTRKKQAMHDIVANCLVVDRD